ncbi:TPR-like protein [Coniochaeta ligniaria NRRL 30616]|uniref:TPR-like protein n=1 Tax=Coniochaeta ligniaria NRRL 30616 TaxID=1408157 RepID=A0A1J7JAF0_9PEZI|nr:TPR-like protein [Coniochaeta ligniaria NRRL 30616]
MAANKALLKEIGQDLQKSRFSDAISKAKEVLERDPRNYQAHIFLAFALDGNKQPEDAESIYTAAAAYKPNDPQAWQGLVKLYQKLGPHKLKQYQHAALKLAEIYRDAGDMYKCQDVVDKFIGYAQKNGERQQYAEALSLILPDSPIYPALEGRVPHPAKTYETIVQIVEGDEKREINTLIGERRTRIGARINDVTLEVKREVFSKSRLGHLYRQLIEWSIDDDVRRTYEEKLFQYCYERLLAFPPGEEKAQELNLVLKLANDMVIIKHPYKAAWDVAIDWQDHKDIKEWDFGVLREYITFFPDSDLTRVLSGFLSSSISPFPNIKEEKPVASVGDETGEDESEDDDEGGVQTTYIPTTEEDRMMMMSEGITSANSLLAYRLMGEYYQYLEEYAGNVDLMHKAKKHLEEEQTKTGLPFLFTSDSYSLYLGTALVLHQSPRYHQDAKALFDGVLSHDPTSTPALIGVGLIWEEEQEYDQAIDFLERALKRDATNLRVKTEAAWVKALKGDYAMGRAELEACIPLIIEKSESKELLAQTQYRLGFCIWNLDTSKAARKDRAGAYAYFMGALRSNLNFAPAYTSLGIYYADYAKDKRRARQCFQKAVELSPSEVESAERLARLFADDGDWDRVELIAQRIVDTGRVKPPPGSKRKGISWPFAALGVAELNKQEYHKAVVSFQSALKLAPDDYHCWVGLGESYYNSGRYIAATKAITNAQKLEDNLASHVTGDTWFTKFMLANIRRELGEFDTAIDLYREVILARPAEEGVIISLMQTLVESATDNLEKGFFGKAIQLARENLNYATKVPNCVSFTFNFWKTIADSCSIFSTIQGHIGEFPVETVKTLLGSNEGEEFKLLQDTDGIGTGVLFAKGLFPDDEKVGVDLTKCLHATILAHKRAIHLSAHDIHAQAVAYYNLGWAEHRAHICLPEPMRKSLSRYLKAAIRCFKRAIELEAGNSEFWNSLGVVSSSVNPAVSQHAFCRSLYLNEKAAHVWSNMGTLALVENDFKLANEAFTRAQSTDPDYAHAWVGQGLVALMYGDAREARGLFTHAMDISGASSLISRQLYSVSMFDHILTAPSNLPITSLIHPVLALTQLQALNPQALSYGHLCALFQERTHDNARAISTLEKICATVEAEYEATELQEAAKRFALAKTDLARSYLSSGSYDKAIEAGEVALSLSSDESENELTPEERRKARLSANLTVGLAHCFSGDVSEAVAFFETALRESDGNPDAVCVLAQVLWAAGGEKEREKARELFFGVLESTPDHVQVVLLMGVVALLDQDEDMIEAVVEQLQALRSTDGKVSSVEQGQIGEVMRAIATLREKTTEEDVLSQIQTDILLRPYLPHGWLELAEAGDGEEAAKAAELAVRVARKGVPPKGDLGAEDLAKAYAGTGLAADGQTAIVVAPWAKEGWVALSEAVSG